MAKTQLIRDTAGNPQQTFQPLSGSGVLVYLTTPAIANVGDKEDVIWDAAEYDDDDYFDPLDAGVLTIPADGLYRLEGFADGEADAGDEVNAGVLAEITRNVGQFITGFMPYNAYQAIFAFWVTDTVRLDAGDEIGMAVSFSAETGGTTWDLKGDSPRTADTTRLRITYLGPLP